MLQLLDVGSLMTCPDQAGPAARPPQLPITSLGKDDAAISTRAVTIRAGMLAKLWKKQDLESGLELEEQPLQPQCEPAQLPLFAYMEFNY